MSAKRIVVLGASGFVGTTLVDRLRQLPDVEVIPVINSAGSAWRLARRAAPLLQVDVADLGALREAMRKATHVVNCTRGPRVVMIDGLKNILAACRAEGVQRLVHLSSVMVYGDPPPPESSHEDAPTHPAPGPDSYGMTKLEQDRMVEAAAKEGLSSVILCPPNISGPFSGYVVGIVNGLRSGAFALVDDGSGPCNLVDVRNLCHAIELALDLDAGKADAHRIFIADNDAFTWRDVADELIELAEVGAPRRIDRATLVALQEATSTTPPTSLKASLRHLVSSDVRAALRKDPLLGKVDRSARALVARLGGSIENRLRHSIEGPTPVQRPDPYAGLAVGLCAQQLRGVRHLNDRAATVLGFVPPLTFRQSMADFRAWYRTMHGMDEPTWNITRRLY